MNYNFYLIISALVLLIPHTQGKIFFSLGKIFFDSGKIFFGSHKIFFGSGKIVKNYSDVCGLEGLSRRLKVNT